MARGPLPPLALAVGFVDAINRGDAARLGELMTDDHQLRVLDERAVVGRTRSLEAWVGYFAAYPAYVVHPRQLVVSRMRVAILGSTTGSHLRLADEEELAMSVIWLAETDRGQVAVWSVLDDSEELRAAVGLDVRP